MPLIVVIAIGQYLHYLTMVKLIVMKKIILALSAFIILIGCSSTRITHSWQSSDIAKKDYKKIIVLALLKNNDREFREKMEGHIVGDLIDLGYNAVASINEFGPKSFENLKEEEALAKLQSSGADAVITVVLLDKERERKYIPGRVIYSPYSMYYRRFGGYYNTMSNRVFARGYYAEQTNYFWESNFYELDNKELLYSIQTKSFDPASASELAHEYGRLIVKDMVKHGVVDKKDTKLKE